METKGWSNPAKQENATMASHMYKKLRMPNAWRQSFFESMAILFPIVGINAPWITPISPATAVITMEYPLYTPRVHNPKKAEMTRVSDTLSTTEPTLTNTSPATFFSIDRSSLFMRDPRHTKSGYAFFDR